MNPGLEWKQALALLGLLARRPVLWTRANLRLINRGLCYLAQNPDLAWGRYLLASSESAPGLDTLVLISDQGRPVFSLLLAKNLTGNLSTQALRTFADLDSFRDKTEAFLQRPLQAVLIEAATFERLNLKLVEEKGLDAFFIVGREILAALSERQIKFSPLMPEAEMLASLDGEELLCKFGPRFGLCINVRAASSFAKATADKSAAIPLKMRAPSASAKAMTDKSGALRGLGLALLSPLTRWRMKRKI